MAGTGKQIKTTDDGFAPPTEQTTRVTQRLYDGNAAETPAGASSGDFYGHSMLKGAINRRGSEWFDATGESEAGRNRVRDTFVNIARETALPESLLVTIADSFIDKAIAQTRPSNATEEAARQVDEQIATWNTEARAVLRETYGKDAEAMLERTRKFVRQSPALAKLLQESGLGSRPDIVAGLAAEVFSRGFR